MDETLANQDNAQVASGRLLGTVLDNKYRVERILGSGGMGYVVAASHVDLGTKVAIKFMAPDLIKDAGAVARFMREARACVRITGEHVARVLDVSRMQDGTPYMVMEHLEGRDLGEVLDEQGRLDTEIAVDFLLQACEAIAEAHRIGIVHRDLKPSNLFLTQRADGSPLIKVLDFGISKVRSEGADQTKLTATQTLLGSPTYMSPEQVRRPDTVDARSDVWTLGVILFELLSDSLPFVGDSHMSVLAAVVSDPIPEVHALIPNIDVRLAAVIQRCLMRDPQQRTPDVGQFAEELAEFAAEYSLVSVERISAVLARSDSSVTPQGLSRKPEMVVATSRSRAGTPARDSASARTVPATPTPSQSTLPNTSVVGTPPEAHTNSHEPAFYRTEHSPARMSFSHKLTVALIAVALGGTALLLITREPAPELNTSPAVQTQTESPAASALPERELPAEPITPVSEPESTSPAEVSPESAAQPKTGVAPKTTTPSGKAIAPRPTPPPVKAPASAAPTSEPTDRQVDPLDGRF